MPSMETVWADGPLFEVNEEYFSLYRFAKKDVELRAAKSQWVNACLGDVATIRCGSKSFRKRITRIYRGSLARIFKDVHYRRIVPEASTVFDAVKMVTELYPLAEDFVAFELEDFV